MTKDEVWAVKYSPKNIDEIVLSDESKEVFDKYLNDKIIPNLMFYGPPGGGKTTLADILTSKSGFVKNRKDNLLILNGSSQSERGIGIVKNLIEPFLKIPPIGEDKYRIVFIDECDNMTSDAFDSLRNVIDTYTKGYGRFICTCNYISKIPDPIISRFDVHKFGQIPKDILLSHCKHILDSENVKFSEADLNIAIDSIYPDVRKLLSVLQRNVVNGEFKLPQSQSLTREGEIIIHFVEMLTFIQNGDKNKFNNSLKNISNLISDEMDFKNIYINLYDNKNVPPNVKILISKFANEHKDCFLPRMHFMTMVFTSVKAITSYGK